MRIGSSLTRSTWFRRLFVAFLVTLPLACSEAEEPRDGNSGGTSNGGSAGAAGTPATGGTSTGGAPTGGTSTGGVSSGAGGTSAAGGVSAAGGMQPTGGVNGGGASATGGAPLGGASGSSGAGSSSGGATAGTGGSAVGGSSAAGGTASGNWVGTWATAAQLTEMTNLPPTPPGLTNNTLRQISYVSIGGSRVRVRFSNVYGNSALTMSSVHLANSTSTHSIEAATDRALTFSGMPSVTVPAGGAVVSDPLDYALAAQTKVAITIAFGATPSNVTGHPGSRTTSYIATGNVASAASLTSPVSTEHWYYVTGIDVEAPMTSRAVVTLGDSITDGRGSTTDGNNRWPDNLSRRLRTNGATAGVAVLNQGIGGNAVVTGGLGPTAVSRFERDVLEQSGVRWVIVLHGVNDIGGATGQAVAQSLITAYQGFVTAARARGVRIYGVPILPFAESNYDSADHEMARQTVNTWIRTPGNFDAVIDLDAAVRDPANPAHLLAAYDSGDHLHLNVAGYQRMADQIDLVLFGQ